MADDTVIDDDDPCAAFIELRKAYRDVVSGKGIRRVRFRNGDEERETEFGQSNITALQTAMNQAKRECMAKDNGGRQRSAIGFGYTGPRPGRIY